MDQFNGGAAFLPPLAQFRLSDCSLTFLACIVLPRLLICRRLAFASRVFVVINSRGAAP